MKLLSKVLPFAVFAASVTASLTAHAQDAGLYGRADDPNASFVRVVTFDQRQRLAASRFRPIRVCRHM